jgi:hypothetical protein
MRRQIMKRGLLGVSAVVVGAALLGSAARADGSFPPRKPGWWQTTMVMTMSMKGQPPDNDTTPFTSLMCSDATTDAITMKQMAGDTGKCLAFDISKSGDTYTITGSCPDPMGSSGVMTTHGTMVFQSDTQIHIVSDTVSPSMSGHVIGDSKWLGACPAGVKPGDFGLMQNGVFKKQGNVLDKP